MNWMNETHKSNVGGIRLLNYYNYTLFKYVYSRDLYLQKNNIIYNTRFDWKLVTKNSTVKGNNN